MFVSRNGRGPLYIYKVTTFAKQLVLLKQDSKFHVEKSILFNNYCIYNILDSFVPDIPVK